MAKGTNKKKSLIARMEAEVDGFLEEQAEEIQNQLDRINKALRSYDGLIARKNQLTQAQRVLLGGGSKTTAGAGGAGKVHQEDVVNFFKRQLEEDVMVLSPEQIAEGIGSTSQVVKGHLQRGKDERFLMVDRGQWALRRPAEGINTVEDLSDN